MRVIRYYTPHDRIAHAERVIHQSRSSSFDLIQRQQKAGALEPSEQTALWRAARQQQELKKLIELLRWMRSN